MRQGVDVSISAAPPSVSPAEVLRKRLDKLRERLDPLAVDSQTRGLEA